MHFIFFLVGLLSYVTQRSSASYLSGDSNGGSQMEGQEAPTFVHPPMMYASPVVAAAPVAPVVHYDMYSPRSGVRNLVGSYAREEGHLSDTKLDLPFRTRSRKLAARRAARMRKNLKKHRKVNKH